MQENSEDRARRRPSARPDRGLVQEAFEQDELHALEVACRALLTQRGPVDAVTRSPAFSRAYAKVMRARKEGP